MGRAREACVSPLRLGDLVADTIVIESRKSKQG